MEIQRLAIPDVVLFRPKVFGDERGFFVETFHAERYREAGLRSAFVQDNVSRSRRGVLRGLHLQHPSAQGKLVMALEGEVFDVAVDVRVGSPTFGRWVGETLSAKSMDQLWVPPGFAHGFCVTSETALFAYKCTDLYRPDTELGIAFDDPDLGIVWPIDTPELSGRDRAMPRLRDIPLERLPRHGEYPAD